jgi:very-short-patch-repair endonuclease
MTAQARRLRGDATRAEKKLWSVLQRAQLNGLSFRRQHPVGTYIVDFYCSAIRLVIEVDGGQHNDPRHQAADARRSQLLRSKGITILRFWNNEVIEKTAEVWDVTSRTAAALSLRPATPTPTLPLLGAGSRQ